MKQSLTVRLWKSSFPKKILSLNKAIFLFGILSLLVDSEVFFFFFSWKSNLIFKMLFALNLTCFIEDIIEISMNLFSKIKHKTKIQFTPLVKMNTEQEETKIEGIPRTEIVRFLFESGGFKNSDFLDTFGKSNKIFQAIGNILEKKGILVRGDKNARVLNPEESIQSCFEKLSEAKLVKEKNNSYSIKGDIQNVFA